MATGRFGSGDRQADGTGRQRARRGGRFMKPVSWPRYMIEKRLVDGRVGYYWSPHKRDLQAGCTLHREALGTDYGYAIQKAALLNTHLDAWRHGGDEQKAA